MYKGIVKEKIYTIKEQTKRTVSVLSLVISGTALAVSVIVNFFNAKK